MSFSFSRLRQGLRMIVCCYSKLRLLIIGERIIETCSMLGSVFDPNSRIRRYVRGILLARRQYQDLCLCTGGADVRTSCDIGLDGNVISN